MEYFFGLLKSEMFYEQEAKYKTLEELEKTIEDYIYARSVFSALAVRKTSAIRTTASSASPTRMASKKSTKCSAQAESARF